MVETGSFRIDRTRALEKLKEFQLENAAELLLPWIRCGVVLGATEFAVRKIPEGIELSFNGRPLERRRLEDPYQALFEESSLESEPYRHLAVGLLAALRLNPSSVAIASGEADRACLLVKSLEEDELIDDPSRPGGSVLRVLWGHGAVDDAIAEAVETGCVLLKQPLLLHGTALSKLPEAATVPVVPCARGSASGFLVSAPLRNAKRVYLYKYGVRVGWVPHDFPLPMVAHVNDDGFRLNASHTGVIQDGFFSGAMELVKDHTGSLLLHASQEQTARCKNEPRRLFEIYGLGERQLPLWLRATAGTLGSSAKKERLAELQWEARVSSWLRFVAARHLSEYAKDREHPSLKALWETPLYMSVVGKPITLLQLAEQCERIGYVPYSDPQIHYPDPWLLRFEPSVHVVWWLDAYDDCLRRIFPRKVREWGAIACGIDLVTLPFRALARRFKKNEPGAAG